MVTTVLVAAALLQAPSSVGPEAADSSSPLRVAVAGSAPFVIDQGSRLQGISVDVWRSVARKADIEHELVAVDSISDAIDGVGTGKFDVAVGPISITSARAQSVSFTQPYYQASLSILADPESASAWNRIKPFLSITFLIGVSVLLLVLALVGVLFWLTERKHNEEQFPANPVRGIGNGLWLALVTMTTVGYGDRAPVSVAGRIVAGVWMILAMLTASSLTASIATALTLSQLDQAAIANAGELRGRTVAVVRDSPSEAFARKYGARLALHDDIEHAISAVTEGQADAVVYDRPILRYFLHQNPEANLVLSEAAYQPRGYGFALAVDSPHFDGLDIAILGLQESGGVERISDKWMGSET